MIQSKRMLQSIILSLHIVNSIELFVYIFYITLNIIYNYILYMNHLFSRQSQPRKQGRNRLISNNISAMMKVCTKHCRSTEQKGVTSCLEDRRIHRTRELPKQLMKNRKKFTETRGNVLFTAVFLTLKTVSQSKC